MDIAILISLLSLFTAFATLFVSSLSPGKVKISYGPTITFFYGKKDVYGRVVKGLKYPLYIYIPTTFMNSGSRTGSIHRVAIALRREDDSEHMSFLHWRAFCSYHREAGIWGEDEPAHELIVKGNSTITKWLSFYWDIAPNLDLKQGSYYLDFYWWSKEDEVPQHERRKLLIDPITQDNLNRIKKGVNKQFVDVILDSKVRSNQLTSQGKVSQLLGTISTKAKVRTARLAIAGFFQL